MPRQKGYLREALVAKALPVFQRLGYQGASTEILVQALSVNRNTVYAEFGSKAGLFAAALDHYSDQFVGALFGGLEVPGATLNEIESLFSQFAASAEGARGLGCLMCNTATELGGAYLGIQPRIEQHMARIGAAFRQALDGAVFAGQISPDTPLGPESRFLTSSCLGIFVLVRADLDATLALGAVEGALLHLRRLRHGALRAPFSRC